jgi:hypothetical protein
MTYHPTLPMVYFSNEQGIWLSTYRREVNGQLKIEQDINVLPPGMSKIGLSSPDLVVTPDRNHLFGGFRGHKQDFDRSQATKSLITGKPSF